MDLLLKQNMLLMVRALFFCMEEQWEKLGRNFDLTPAQQHILYLLSTNERTLSPSQISELGCWHASTVTRLLRPLEAKKFIEINVDKTKPKFKKVTITNEGLSILEKIVATVKNLDDFPFSLLHLSDAEVIQFLKIGYRIIDEHKGEDFKCKVLEARMEGMDYA